jgi:hypothetical protein
MAKFQKKVLTKTIETADDQERALAMLRQQPFAPPPPPQVVVQPKESFQTMQMATPTPIQVREMVTPPAEPKTDYKTKYPKETQRVNLDLPQDLYDAVQEHIRRNGQTMKGFFSLAAWDFIQKNQK